MAMHAGRETRRHDEGQWIDRHHLHRIELIR
jgi:hypothetical protein